MTREPVAWRWRIPPYPDLMWHYQGDAPRPATESGYAIEAEPLYADASLGRDAVIEECAKHFDRKAKELDADIFAQTVSRSQICRTVADELRALKTRTS